MSTSVQKIVDEIISGCLHQSIKSEIYSSALIIYELRQLQTELRTALERTPQDGYSDPTTAPVLRDASLDKLRK